MADPTNPHGGSTTASATPTRGDGTYAEFRDGTRPPSAKGSRPSSAAHGGSPRNATDYYGGRKIGAGGRGEDSIFVKRDAYNDEDDRRNQMYESMPFHSQSVQTDADFVRQKYGHRI